MITLTELDEVCAAAAGAMAMTMQRHFPLSRLAHGNKKKRKEKKKKKKKNNRHSGFPGGPPP